MQAAQSVTCPRLVCCWIVCQMILPRVSKEIKCLLIEHSSMTSRMIPCKSIMKRRETEKKDEAEKGRETVVE